MPKTNRLSQKCSIIRHANRSKSPRFIHNSVVKRSRCRLRSSLKRAFRLIPGRFRTSGTSEPMLLTSVPPEKKLFRREQR